MTEVTSSNRIGSILRRALIGFAALIALAVSGVIALVIYEQWQGRPQLATSINGLALGDKLSDVFFKHGEFVEVAKDGRKGAKQSDPDVLYKQKDGRLGIAVRNGRVVWIAHSCAEHDSQALNGIYCGGNGDRIHERFGSIVRVLCAVEKDEHAPYLRVYDIVQYGTRFVLYKNRVVRLSVFQPQELESLVGINWEKCE